MVKTVLGELIPKRLAEQLCQHFFPTPLPLPQVSEKELAVFLSHAAELANHAQRNRR